MDGLRKELCANATSYNEKEISYVDELASCRETIKYLEDELDYLKYSTSSEQNSLQQVKIIQIIFFYIIYLPFKTAVF
jgi:hypothetical protein